MIILFIYQSLCNIKMAMIINFFLRFCFSYSFFFLFFNLIFHFKVMPCGWQSPCQPCPEIGSESPCKHGLHQPRSMCPAFPEWDGAVALVHRPGADVGKASPLREPLHHPGPSTSVTSACRVARTTLRALAAIMRSAVARDE